MKNSTRFLSLLMGALTLFVGFAPSLFSMPPVKVSYDSVATALMRTGLQSCEAFQMLKELTAKAPHRLSGSAGAAKAIEITRGMMNRLGFQEVHTETVTVPHWVRGSVEEAVITQSPMKKGTPLTICALGRSIGTPKDGVEGAVLEVKSFEELRSIGTGAKGKIVFFNRPFDAAKFNTFEAYGGAVDQRSRGAIEAAKVGAVGVLVRSMTLAIDDVPHTGSMSYDESVRKIPAAAVSTVDAAMLSGLIEKKRTYM